ncbi:hypothetical protein ATO12_20920 [Aquimarina atlantica]|uniref:Uncharacterized protein n=1 Tax=Aquimarina atlantica TaxID=1317122 RepID=A0A023BRJ7_9FLAO|nr:hypothetical protein [Aquimarina atlantica]EZH72601.1 hypothetical protein ATO12_20920 [Aquimarina atlantica]
MSLNIIAYSIYIFITAFIIIKVGLICYQNGNIFVTHLIPNDTEFCIRINNILLIGYYLLNIGYAIITLSGWPTLQTITQMVEVIFNRMGIIIYTLAGLHYFNLFWITKFIKNFK